MTFDWYRPREFHIWSYWQNIRVSTANKRSANQQRESVGQDKRYDPFGTGLWRLNHGANLLLLPFSPPLLFAGYAVERLFWSNQVKRI